MEPPTILKTRDVFNSGDTFRMLQKQILLKKILKQSPILHKQIIVPLLHNAFLSECYEQAPGMQCNTNSRRASTQPITVCICATANLHIGSQ